MTHGSSEELPTFWNWQAACQKCGLPVKAPRDLFCGNFGVSRKGWRPCRRGWHAKCNTASPVLDFHVAKPENDEGMSWIKRKDEGRFLSARNGDCLAAPFQCEYCWVVNLTGREAKASSLGDRRLCGYIRRANLDIFWSREPGTVGGIMSALKKGRRLSEELGMKG